MEQEAYGKSLENAQLLAFVKALSEDKQLQVSVAASPREAFRKHGISFPPVFAEAVPAPGSAADSGLSAEVHWWGFYIILNESFTKMVVSGAEGASAIAGIIAAAQPELAPIAGIIGGIMALQGVVISAVDQGNGVYYMVTWPQAIPALLPTAMIPYAN